MNEPTMIEAAQTNNGSASTAPDTVAATATKLYGGEQEAPTTQNPQAETKATEGSDKGDQTDAPKADAKAEATAKPEGAPEKYEFKAPEGKEFDPEVVNAFSKVAKELNLTQDAAQKVLDEMGPALANRQNTQIQAIRKEWVAASTADKEFGGDKLAENLGTAKKALETFGSPELRNLLNQSGFGDNPEVIRFMFRVGKAVSEDRFVSGATSTPNKGAPKSFAEAADALYSTQQ